MLFFQDSLLSVWRDGGECELQREIHQGSGVCCFDVDESKGLVVTGGRDGGINLWPLEPTSVIPQSLPPPTDMPRRLSLLSDYRVLIITQLGTLMLSTTDTWSTVFSDSRLENYCLLEISPNRQLVALASIQGQIIILNSKMC